MNTPRKDLYKLLEYRAIKNRKRRRYLQAILCDGVAPTTAANNLRLDPAREAKQSEVVRVMTAFRAARDGGGARLYETIRRLNALDGLAVGPPNPDYVVETFVLSSKDAVREIWGVTKLLPNPVPLPVEKRPKLCTNCHERYNVRHDVCPSCNRVMPPESVPVEQSAARTYERKDYGYGDLTGGPKQIFQSSYSGIAYSADGKHLVFSQNSSNVTIADVSAEGLLEDNAQVSVPPDSSFISCLPNSPIGPYASPCGTFYTPSSSYPDGVALSSNGKNAYAC